MEENHEFRVSSSQKSTFLYFPRNPTRWDEYMLNDVTLENFGLTQNVSEVFALNFGTIIVLGGGFLPQHLLQRVSMKTVRMR